MYFRLGYTESTLLFIHFLEKFHLHDLDKSILQNYKQQYINWLYTTSGFYDTTIKGTNFDFNMEFDSIQKSSTYCQYFDLLLEFVSQNRFNYLEIHIHTLSLLDNKFTYLFYQYIHFDPNSYYDWKSFMSTNIHQSNCLIISNLGHLMCDQYNNGNLNNIHNMVLNITSLHYYKPGYTFENNKLKSADALNMLDNSYHHWGLIKQIIYNKHINFIIISAGAYSFIYAYFCKLHNIQFITIGGDLEVFFGINTKRTSIFYNKIINKYFINVPETDKPQNYKEIEGGCYW